MASSDAPAAGGRWFCEACTSRWDRQGHCGRCPDEPLLDLADEDTRLFIEEQDSARVRKRFGLYVVLLLPVGVVIWWLMVTSRVGGGGFGVLQAAVAGAVVTGLATVLMKLFPPPKKLPAVTDEQLSGWGEG